MCVCVSFLMLCSPAAVTRVTEVHSQKRWQCRHVNQSGIADVGAGQIQPKEPGKAGQICQCRIGDGRVG